MISPAKLGGRHRSVTMREILNTLLDQNRIGCQSDLLPHVLAANSSAHEYYASWRDDDTWQALVDTLC